MITRYANNMPTMKALLMKGMEEGSRDEDVRDLAVQIVAGQPSKAGAIYSWVRDHVSYVQDPVGAELLTAPGRIARAYRSGAAVAEDCDGIAMLIAALCRSLGIGSRIVLLATGGRGIDHALAEVEEDGEWLTADPTPAADGHRIPVGWVLSPGVDYTQRVVIE